MSLMSARTESGLSVVTNPPLEAGFLPGLFLTDQLTNKQIDQLVYYSNNDTAVKDNTRDEKRFKDKESFENWLKKERYKKILTDEFESFLGLCWLGKEDM